MRRMALGTGLALLLAACGGGGPSGTQVQVNLVDGLDNPIQATAAAYRVGTGPFQALSPTGPGQYRFTVPSGEKKYTVVFRCPFFGILSSRVLAVSYELTLAEATSFKVRCPLAYAGPEANLNETNDNTSSQDFTGRQGQAYSATSSVFLVDEGQNDDKVNDLPNFFQVPVGQNREVAIYGQIGNTYYFGRALVDVTYTTTEIGQITVSQVGDNFTTSHQAQAHLLGKEVRIPLGSGNIFPKPSSDSGDLYELVSFSFNGDQARLRRVPGNALASPVDTALPSLSFNPSVSLNAGSLPTFQGLTDPQFPNERPLRGYLLTLSWLSDWMGAFWQHLVGQGVLQTLQTDNYALPDPTGVTGLEALKPTSGDSVIWQAVALGLNRDLSQVLGARPIPQGTGPLDALDRHLPLDLEAAVAFGSYTQP
uniref:Lipoprotein n=1 Tax=Thermus islandicus TaxID=540988 RepID=A0A831U2P2_9DEIN